VIRFPFDQAMGMHWYAVGNGDPSGKPAGLYVNGRLVAFDKVGERLELAKIAALGKDALAIMLAREFSATDKDGYACCPECSARHMSPPKHASMCTSGAVCERYRAERIGEA
jgi:hypothetical protein